MTLFVDELPPAPNTSNKGGRGNRISPELLAYAADLRANPQRWGVYPRPIASADGAQVTASRIRTGQAPAFQDGVYEATHRGGTVYVRWVSARQ